VHRSTDSFLKGLLAAEAEDAAALGKGQTVGRYVIIDKVGIGGMGVVYKAYDPTLDRRVALKLLRLAPRGATGAALADERVARVLGEAQALARLSHPNVIAVHDVGREGRDVFCAMEFVEGDTLSTWCKAAGRSWREVLDAFIAAGRGLAAAHDAGLVHRDFKPDNVMVGADGRVRVLDFGLARAASTAAEGAGAVVGTPAYMAPEQHMQEAADARADQFAFCAALYEALYGRLPFAGRTVLEIEREVLAGRIVEPPTDAPGPSWLRDALRRGLARQPADRYPSMTALLAAVDRAPRASRRAWLVAGVSAGIALVAVGYSTLGGDGAGPCVGANRALQGIWDADAKRAVQAAFANSGRSHAVATFARLERILDGHAAAWVTMRTEACAETRVHHRQPEDVLTLRNRCLDEWLGEMGQLTARLAADPEPRVVDSAVHRAFDLAGLDRCADIDALRAAQADLATMAARHADQEGACGVPPNGRYGPIEVGRVWVYDVVDPSTGLPRNQDPKVITVEGEDEIGGCKGSIRAFRTRRDTGTGYAYRWVEVKTVPSGEGRPPGMITVRHRDQWFRSDGTITKDEYYVPGRARLDETCLHSLVGVPYLDSYDEVEVEAGADGCGEELVRKTKTFDWQVVEVGANLTLTMDYSHPACCDRAAPMSCRPPPDGPGYQCEPTPGGAATDWTCTFATLEVRRLEVQGGKKASYWFALGVGEVKEESRGEEIETLVCFTVP
jgi:hypothetical protein